VCVCATLSLPEVEIDDILVGAAIDHEMHAEVDTNDYIDQRGIGIGNNGKLICWFGNSDFITYRTDRSTLVLRLERRIVCLCRRI